MSISRYLSCFLLNLPSVMIGFQSPIDRLNNEWPHKGRETCTSLCLSVPGLVKIKPIMFYCGVPLPSTLNKYSETCLQLHLCVCVCVWDCACLHVHVFIALLAEGKGKSSEGVIWNGVFQTAPLCSITAVFLLLCCVINADVVLH